MAVKSIEFMCTHCGMRTVRSATSGRPSPGICPKKNNKPHSWVINRKIS